MKILSRYRAHRARARHLAYLRWLRRNKCIMPKPHHSTRRPGPECVCAVLAALVLAHPAHAEVVAIVSEPGGMTWLLGLGVLAIVVRGSRFSRRRFKDPRMR